MKITSLEELKEIAKGEVIELPGFNEKPFVVRAKRPSLLNLVSSGAIPNELLTTAYSIFNGRTVTGKQEAVSMKETNDLLRIVAEKALIEPTLKQIEEAGLELTDLQLLELYNYSQQGVRALQSFREKQKNIKNN